MSLVAGQVFAGYRILRTLGSGGMGQVYLAQHPRLPRLDALKLLQADVSADDDYRARFEREADLASTLWHPHIVGVHDRGEADGRFWISMDFVDGVDAAELLASRHPDGMPAATVVAITTSVASALDYAHKKGLLHRDVKPANIMLTHVESDSEQRILLADFGIARSIDDISGLTSTNMTVGTVAYAAPEQLMGDDVDGRADQYALAATAYHLLTGTPLFAHSNPAVVISRHLNAAPPQVATSRPALAGVDDVLQRALAKNPSERFGNATEFARKLREACEQGPHPSPQAATVEAAASVSTRPRGEPPPTAPVSHLSRSSGPAKMWAAAGTVLAALVLIVVLWRPWDTGGVHSESAAMSSEMSTERAVPTPPLQQATTTTTKSPPPVATPPPAPSTPPATEVITADAVDPAGQPSTGYTVQEATADRAPLSECSEPSVSAVRPNIYSCYPFAASATTCWPSAPDAMLCLDDPWQKQLTRFEFATSTILPVQPTATPEPVAVLLDDGSKCGILIGGARGRADGTTPLYGCERGARPPIVTGSRGVGGGIERTSSAWTAWVAEENEPMQARRVTRAIFAG